MIKYIKSKEEFHETIKEGNYLVDFYADWCGPCKMIAPILEELESEFNILKINTDENEELTIEYGIMSIPTLLYFENNKLKNKSIGYMTKEEIIDLTK